MANYTIVARDNVVIVDGEARDVDCSDLVAEGKAAVQWYGTKGHVEFINAPDVLQNEYAANQPISSFAEYQSYIDAWVAAAPSEGRT
jgi:hypothetical protein